MMLDTDVVTYGSIARWVDAPTPELGEQMNCRMDMAAEFAEAMSTQELVDTLVEQARDGARFKIAERLGKPPPDDANIEVLLRDRGPSNGRPIGWFCTLLPEPQAQQEPLDA